MQTTIELTDQTTVCIHLNSNITSITLKGSLSAIWTEIHCMTLLRWLKITCETFPVMFSYLSFHASSHLYSKFRYLIKSTRDPINISQTDPFFTSSYL